MTECREKHLGTHQMYRTIQHFFCRNLKYKTIRLQYIIDGELSAFFRLKLHSFLASTNYRRFIQKYCLKIFYFLNYLNFKYSKEKISADKKKHQKKPESLLNNISQFLENLTRIVAIFPPLPPSISQSPCLFPFHCQSPKSVLSEG